MAQYHLDPDPDNDPDFDKDSRISIAKKSRAMIHIYLGH